MRFVVQTIKITIKRRLDDMNIFEENDADVSAAPSYNILCS